MNLSRVKVWGAEVLYASDLNTEFNNIVNHEIDNDDIKTAAGIEGSKLKDADIDLSKLKAGTNGDILYYNSGWLKLAKGSDGEVLTLASGVPTWA